MGQSADSGDTILKSAKGLQVQKYDSQKRVRKQKMLIDKIIYVMLIM